MKMEIEIEMRQNMPPLYEKIIIRKFYSGKPKFWPA